VGQKTATSPEGREPALDGSPIHVCELLATIEGAAYLERVALADPEGVIRTKRAIEKAFRTQKENRGFSLVEILSPCPTYWRMEPVEALRHINEVMSKSFPPGVFRDWE
jgi:2-oxoglutarate ferredoxin oxidoreductase subunit beta